MGNKIDTFKNGNYMFPSDDVNPKDKGESWCLEAAKAIYSDFAKGRSSIGYGDKDIIKSNRLYAQGNQPESYYKDFFSTKNNKGEWERKGMMNVNWSIFSPAPKFLRVVSGMFEKTEHTVMVNAIDEKSGAEKEQKKWDIWFQKQYAPFLKQVDELVNLPHKEPDFIPETMEELELYDSLGGIKLKSEIAMEKLIDYTFYISDWKEIKRKLIIDLLENNIACAKDYVDVNSGRVRTRYVDIENLIIDYSSHFNHKNSRYAGEIREYTIEEIRREGGYREEEILSIAQSYQNYKGNLNGGEFSDFECQDVNKRWKYDSFKVLVLDFEIKSIDSQYYSKRITKGGNEIRYKENFGKESNGVKKIGKTDIHTVYKGKWIIDTDKIFDYGLMNDIPRKDKEAYLSFHVYKVNGKSLVELIKPNLDNIQMAWLKLQNALAMAPNAGLAVEYTALQNMSLGGRNMDPLDILTIRRDTGTLIYKATTHRGVVNSPNAGKPVQELRGGMQGSLEEFISLFETNLKIIRDFTGINEIADASSPDPEQSVTGSQYALIATNNALKSYYSGYVDIKENISKNICSRIKTLLKYNDVSYNNYYPVVGKASLESLKITAKNIASDYGLKIEAKPDEEVKEHVRRAALTSMDTPDPNKPSINMADYLFIERLLQYGNIKYAQATLGYKLRKSAQRIEKSKLENIKVQSSEIQQQNESKMKADIAKKQTETNEDIRLEEAKAKFQIEIDNNQYERKERLLEKEMELLSLKKNIEPNTAKDKK